MTILSEISILTSSITFPALLVAKYLPLSKMLPSPLSHPNYCPSSPLKYKCHDGRNFCHFISYFLPSIYHGKNEALGWEQRLPYLYSYHFLHWVTGPTVKILTTVHGLDWSSLSSEFANAFISLTSSLNHHTFVQPFSLCLMLYLLCSKRAGARVFHLYTSQYPSSQVDSQCPSDIFSVNN